MFHKIKTIKPLDYYILYAQFIDGEEKIYDLKPVMEKYKVFQLLKNLPALYKLVKVDVGGYGIVWNEDIDLAAEDVWVNGKNIDGADKEIADSR